MIQARVARSPRVLLFLSVGHYMRWMVHNYVGIHLITPVYFLSQLPGQMLEG